MQALKLYRVAEPDWLEPHFAQLAQMGRWSSPMGVCRECGGSSQKRIRPLVAEWQPGSDVIADVTWAAFQPVVIRSLFDSLRGEFAGFDCGQIEFFQDRKLKRPERPATRTKRRVWLPYEGPELCEFWVDDWRQLDPSASTTEMTYKCHTCGRERWDVVGIEHWDYGADEHGLASWTNYPRLPGTGIYVNGRRYSVTDIFRLDEFPAWIICTGRVRDYIVERGWNNIGFLEVGELTF